MVKSNDRPSPRRSPLGRRLQREAAESRPAFCETFHRRILSTVEQAAASPRRDSTSRLRRRWLAVSAAACLLCMTAVGWRLREMREGGAPPVAQTTEVSVPADFAWVVELPDLAATELNGMAASARLTPSSASLSGDARQTVEVLLRRLPVDVELVTDNR